MGTSSIILSVTLLFLFSNFIFLQAIQLPSQSNGVHCVDKERQSLLKFKTGVTSDPFESLSSWLGSDCCTWLGVKCRYPTGEVQELDLGMLSLEGEFANSLNELPHLSYLNLSSNAFSGMIPNAFGNLSNLRVLDLSSNSFTGMMPSAFSNLSNLNYLNLSYNSFSGLIGNEFGNLSSLHVLDLYLVGYESYVSDLSWLSGLSRLKFLDMSSLNLSLATNHWLESINRIPSLTELHLESSNLDAVPKSLPYLNLTSLSVLDLSLNNFNTEAPQWLYNISSSITVLKLSECHFKGPISSILGNGYDSNLEELGLHFNDFDGELPDSLEHLKSLKILHLYSNSISGQIPQSLGTLSKLSVLDLSNNRWEGSVSEDHFRGLSNLKELSISSSNSDFVFNLSPNWAPPFSLRSVNISGHNLGPEFPKWLRNQTQLEFVGLKYVNISDTIPTWFWKVSQYIQWLDLSYNQLRGTVLNSQAIFSPDALIDLSFNFLEGKIPVFPNVSVLYLGNNSFSGTIPENIDQLMPRLIGLDLFGNKLTGSIPSSLGNLEGLFGLDLSNNNLSGKIPDLWMNNMLSTFDLSDNNLSGKFPASLCSLPFLLELKLSNNNLHGELPTSVTECKSLAVLDLGENKFTGIVPKWVGESRSLQQLRLRGNFFNGSISRQICRLQRLHILDLAQNNLSGSIPKCLGWINGMKTADQNSSQRSDLDVNTKGHRYTYSRYVLKLVILIDLSCNNLIGIMPENITNLIGLGTLNLSNNHLTGRIPFDIGKMQNLETLDLSSNNFSGQIPQSMSSMTFLSNLNFSHNNLSGRIPSGSQFQTFNVSIYEGNAGLCGNPLSAKCESLVVEEGQDDDKKHEHEDEKDNKLGIFVSAALGFVFGFWSFCGSLVISKSWRDAYYGYLVRIKDRVMLVVSMNWNKLQRPVANQRTT